MCFWYSPLASSLLDVVKYFMGARFTEHVFVLFGGFLFGNFGLVILFFVPFNLEGALLIL